MTRAVLVTLGVLAVVAAPAGAGTTVEPASSVSGGEWSVDGRDPGDHVHLTLVREWGSGGNRNRWSSTTDVERDQLIGITPSRWASGNGPVSFRIVRDAGRFVCEGRMANGKGSGDFTFEPDAGYRAKLEQAGLRGIRRQDLERLTLHDVDLDLVRAFQSRGLRPTVDDLVRIRSHGISADYVDDLKQAGIADLDVEDLVRLKIHGVEPAYARDVTGSGRRTYTAEQLVRLKIHGVDAAMPGELAKLGYGALPAEELVRLRINGVSSEYVRDLHAAGYTGISTGDLVRLHTYGVTADGARRAKRERGDLSVDQLLRLKTSGKI